MKILESQKDAAMERRYLAWQTEFLKSQSELLIGANFDASGGVRNHVHAIHLYTQLRSELVPSEQRRVACPYSKFMKHTNDFLSIQPSRSLKAVHSHVSPWFIDWCCRHRCSRIRWVHTHHLLYYHDTQPQGLPQWQLDLNSAGLNALRKCDVPLVVSRSQQRALKDLHGIDAHYLPNGVDVQYCDRSNADNFRRRFRIGKPFVLWMGRNEPVKNPREFLLAATALPNLQFVMAGDNCSAAELLESTSSSVPSNVLLTGSLPRQLAQDALAACELLCVTSLREGLPTLILEAMTHQRPIVTSDAEGCLDATDGDTFAKVYRRGDVSALCDLIQRAMREREDVIAARKRVLNEFDWRVIAKKLDDIYVGRTV